EHARRNGGTSLQRFVERGTRQFANANCQRILELVGRFDADWHSDLEKFLKDDVKDAVDSVVSLRNRIAHGTPVGITYQRIREYYIRVQGVVDRVAGICRVT